MDGASCSMDGASCSMDRGSCSMDGLLVVWMGFL